MYKRIAVLAIMVVGVAFAQTTKPFAGVSLVYQWVAGIQFSGLELQAGSFDLFGDSGGRANVGIGLGRSYLEIGADWLIPISKDRLMPYSGAGLSFLTSDGTNFLGLRGIVGANYSTESDVGLFGELAPALYLVNGGPAFGMQLRFGANYLF
jgi:hypothetical protein